MTMTSKDFIKLELVEIPNRPIDTFLKYAVFFAVGLIPVFAYFLSGQLRILFILLCILTVLVNYFNVYWLNKYRSIGQFQYSNGEFIIKTEGLKIQTQLNALTSFKVHVDGYEGEPFAYSFTNAGAFTFRKGIDNYITFIHEGKNMKFNFKLDSKIAKDIVVRTFDGLNASC